MLFICIEQCVKLNEMVLVEREILNMALEALKEKLALPDHLVTQEDYNEYDAFDAVIQIMNVDFLCVIQNNITAANLNAVVCHIHLQLDKNITTMPVILITKYINPTVFDKLVDNGINILDCAGNCHIKYMNGNVPVFYITNKGEKNVFAKEKVYPVFQEAGIKVIFYLLQGKCNVNKTYREIQENTGVALGTIKNVFDELTARNFILLTDKGRLLKNTKALLDLWVENYNQVLKPKLYMGTMAFRTNDLKSRWREMQLPDGMYWGGEVAANLMDNYLLPGAFDIYTDVPTAQLMKTGFVMQDPAGEIKVYQKFWKWNTEEHLVPVILAYADLMGSGNSRCIEAAKRLKGYGFID